MSLIHEINNIDYQKANEKLYHENYISSLLTYYGESTRKQKTRRKLMDDLKEYIVVKKNYRATMSEISSALEMERKSLYRYFPTIDDIIIDLAYVMVTSNNSRYLIKAKEINELENLSNTEKFKLTLKEVGKLMIVNRTSLEYLSFFDDHFNSLEQGNLTRKRYQDLITGFKTQNHYLKMILEQLDQENQLQNHDAVTDYIEVTEQALSAFVSRTLKKENESYRFDLENIDVLINILTCGIIKKEHL